MPWTQKQHRYFEAIAHGSAAPPKGMTRGDAMKMASEGILSRQPGARAVPMPTLRTRNAKIA